MTQYLLIAVVTALITAALSWTVWRVAIRYKLHPAIRERDVHTRPTPRLGGIAMFLGVVAAFAISSTNPFFSIFWTNPWPTLSILAATLLIVLVGIADDLWDLDWMIKLGASSSRRASSRGSATSRSMRCRSAGSRSARAG